MKQTRIEVIDALPGHVYPNRQVLVNWHRNGVLRTIVSSMLEDTAPPEKVAHVLRELATRIERDCLGGPPQVPEVSFVYAHWSSFVRDVNRTEAFLVDSLIPLRHDPTLPPPGPTVPQFEFFGWKVFRR